MAGLKGVMSWLTALRSGSFEWEGATVGVSHTVKWDSGIVGGTRGQDHQRADRLNGQHFKILEKVERRKGDGPFMWS